MKIALIGFGEVGRSLGEELAAAHTLSTSQRHWALPAPSSTPPWWAQAWAGGHAAALEGGDLEGILDAIRKATT